MFFCVLCAWGALLNSCSWFAWGIWRLSSSPTLLLPHQNGNSYPHRISRHGASAKHFSTRGTFLMSSSPKFLRLWTHYHLWRQVGFVVLFIVCRPFSWIFKRYQMRPNALLSLSCCEVCYFHSFAAKLSSFSFLLFYYFLAKEKNYIATNNWRFPYFTKCANLHRTNTKCKHHIKEKTFEYI